MKLIADTHTHTVASGHAHSTVLENAVFARKKGFRFLVVSDHASAIPGAPKPIYFEALPDVLPEVFEGVYLLTGCEANVVSVAGELDLPDKILKSLDIVIASMHNQAFSPSTSEVHTAAWLAVCNNPHVDILGHLGDERFSFDHEAVVRCCSETGTIIEINSHSFSARPGSKKNCPHIAKLCAQYGVPIVISSDSHFAFTIGDFQDAVAALEEIGFPEDLILNADFDRFAEFAHRKTGRSFPRLDEGGV